MNCYTIFDDFDLRATQIIRDAGIMLDIHPQGVPRPDASQMKRILEQYDAVIIGTTQKITEDMFDGITAPRIIATASVGLDHIRIPEDKKGLVTVYNTPKANAQAVAEYTFAAALSCCKRIPEGNRLYREGKNNKQLSKKPIELYGKVLGVIGAGNISRRIMEFGEFFGMQILCWTRNPEKHQDLLQKGISFGSLEDIAKSADIISVNLPNKEGTKGIISEELVSEMKPDAIFVSVSRLPSVNAEALIRKSEEYPNFYTCMDVDLDQALMQKAGNLENVIITPHIAGGTVETRKRMFVELANQIATNKA